MTNIIVNVITIFRNARFILCRQFLHFQTAFVFKFVAVCVTIGKGNYAKQLWRLRRLPAGRQGSVIRLDGLRQAPHVSGYTLRHLQFSCVMASNPITSIATITNTFQELTKKLIFKVSG